MMSPDPQILLYPVFSVFDHSLMYISQETSKIKMVFKGHLDYLHCIIARKGSNQVKCCITCMPYLNVLTVWNVPFQAFF